MNCIVIILSNTFNGLKIAYIKGYRCQCLGHVDTMIQNIKDTYSQYEAKPQHQVTFKSMF